jgi:hypothetical protein
MHKSIRLRRDGRRTIALAVALAGFLNGIGVARAADPNADPNIDPILPDPVTDGRLFPPAMATAGTGDPGPELRASPVSAEILAGHGPGCGPTSPCAVNSPPLMTLGPVVPPKAARASGKSGAGG